MCQLCPSQTIKQYLIDFFIICPSFLKIRQLPSWLKLVEKTKLYLLHRERTLVYSYVIKLHMLHCTGINSFK